MKKKEEIKAQGEEEEGNGLVLKERNNQIINNEKERGNKSTRRGRRGEWFGFERKKEKIIACAWACKLWLQRLHVASTRFVQGVGFLPFVLFSMQLQL